MSNPYSPPLTSYPDTARPYQQPFLAEAGPTQLTIDVLRQTKPWVMFVSVLGFLGSALCALAGVGMMVIGAFGGMGAHTPAFPALALGAIYLPLALLYIYPSMKLWSYGSAIGRLVANRSSEDLEAAQIGRAHV